MRTFTDNAGRQWQVEINVAALKRVRAFVGVDLMQAIEGGGGGTGGSAGLIEKLVRDPVLLCDVVFALCKPEADARSVTDEEFGRAMAGDAIEHATAAVLEELVGFCPSPRDRANLGRVLKATREVMDKARDLASRRIDRLIESGQLDRLAETALADEPPPPPMPRGLSGTAPEPSGSIPGP
jgi:hypothetical protein